MRCATKTRQTGPYRETEVRLADHQELRETLGLSRVPDHTTLYRCLNRLTEEAFIRLLDATVQAMPPPAAGGSTVAVDGTGLSPGAISTFFVHRIQDRGTGLTWRHWLDLAPLAEMGIVADLSRQLILAQMARPGPCKDWQR